MCTTHLAKLSCNLRDNCQSEANYDRCHLIGTRGVSLQLSKVVRLAMLMIEPLAGLTGNYHFFTTVRVQLILFNCLLIVICPLLAVFSFCTILICFHLLLQFFLQGHLWWQQIVCLAGQLSNNSTNLIASFYILFILNFFSLLSLCFVKS